MLDFNKEVASIEGWLTKAEGLFLYNSARKVKSENAVVEIGSWKGKSTICFGRGLQDGNNGKAYAVDPHIGSSEHQKMFGRVDTFEEFRQNISKAGVDKYIEPIRDTSKNAAENFTEPVGFIFIDGAHEYKFVNLDFNIWFPKVIDGGLIAFHDSFLFLGPNLVTTKLLFFSSKIKNAKLIDTITCFEKVKENSLLDRIKNICFIAYRNLFGIIGPWKIKYKGSKVMLKC